MVTRGPAGDIAKLVRINARQALRSGDLELARLKTSLAPAQKSRHRFPNLHGLFCGDEIHVRLLASSLSFSCKAWANVRRMIEQSAEERIRKMCPQRVVSFLLPAASISLAAPAWLRHRGRLASESSAARFARRNRR